MTRASGLAHLRGATRAASRFLMAAGAAGILLTTAIVGWQVFGRNVLNSSPSWSEQLALTLMIWYVAFGAAAGVRDGFHIRIVALESAVPRPVARVMRLASEGLVGLMGCAMLVGGSTLVLRTWEHVIPSLGIPRGLAYLGLPLAGALIALFAVERVLEILAGEREGDDPSWN